MNRILIISAAIAVGTLSVHALGQQADPQSHTPPTPPPPAPAPQPQPVPQPQVIYPVRGKPGVGVPAALPSPRSTPIGVPSSAPPIRTTPIVQTPGPTQPDVPRAPAPNDGSEGVARLRRWVAGHNDGNIYLYDWRYMGYQGVTPSAVPSDRRYRGTWNPWGFNNGWGIPVVDVSSGNVRGYYNNNDWGLAFHLGAGFPSVNYPTNSSLFKYPSRYYRSYYWPWSGATYSYGDYGYYNPYLIVGNTQSYLVDPQMVTPSPTAPAREATALERAESAFHSGDAAEAARQLKLHLRTAPDDAGVERLLAVALLDDRKTDQAVAVLLHAYTKQPQLARDPIDPRLFSAGEYDHHLRFTKVMEYANRLKTGGSLFAACVLAQSEGRLDTAKKLLDRAIAEGLDKKVADEMTLALTNK